MIHRVIRGLRRFPPLYHAIRISRNGFRRVFGPGTLKRRVAAQVAAGEPVRIIIGAGYTDFRGWIPTEMQFLNMLDDSHWQRAFGENSIDAILAEHVWEHLTPQDGRTAAANCFKYLKPGGYMRVAVPDGNHPDPDYIDFVRVGGSGVGADDHKVLYTADTFRDLFAGVGFDVTLLEYYDTAHNFHGIPFDAAQGVINRKRGKTEPRSDGTQIQYTSVILDAHKPRT